MSSWMVPYTKIKDSGDQKQIDFIDNVTKNNDNTWIQGFAGSGKSIVLVHSIVNIINENPNAKICVVVFTNSLIEMFTAGMKELKIPSNNFHLTTYHKFVKTNGNYDYIFCDEVQDLPKSVLENMKNRALKQLIVAGDSNQSIYDVDPSTREEVVKISEIGVVTNSTSYQLDTIHRLTKNVIKLISVLLPDMNIFSAKQNRTKKEISVRLAKANNKIEECEYILSEAENAISVGQNVVILLPYHHTIAEFINIILKIKGIAPWDSEKNLNRWNKPDYSKLHQYLKQHKVDIEYLGNGYGDLYETTNNSKIIIMTYHSAKGLDFDNVFLPFLSPNTFNYYFTKTLFMVGMTRSKNNLFLTYNEDLHSYVKDFKESCQEIDISSLNSRNTNNDFDDFDF